MTNYKPWEIYVNQMFPLSYGYPLWYPAPEKIQGSPTRQIDPGVVGYIDDGRLRQLFNVRKPADDPCNLEGVPSDCVPLDIYGLDLRSQQVINQELLTSRTIRSSLLTAPDGPIR